MQVLMQYPLAGIIVILVGLFLWFLRDWAKAERQARADEAKAEREARAKEQQSMRDYMSVQNELFLQSVKDIRDQHNSSMSAITEELKANLHEVSRLATIVTAHDAASRERGRNNRG
jgi:hypothetical protein